MGYEFADAQNITVRCFLNQFSKNFNSYFNADFREKTLKYFDYKCPYSGVELTQDNIVQDHIVPMNKINCGLHLFGNILLVDKKQIAVNLQKV